MPEVIFAGPAGRLEGRYQPPKEAGAPVALVLHPHPQFGGTMNNQACFDMYNMFISKGMGALRFNFRGVGRSQGEFDQGIGELSDAATALDWLQAMNPNAANTWVAGFSFGAWVGMQLLMRRPEIIGFISASIPANVYDFSFLAPCPSSGLVIHGGQDKVSPFEDTKRMVERTRTQKGRVIDLELIEEADHFFANHLEVFMEKVEGYVDQRLAEQAATAEPEAAE